MNTSSQEKTTKAFFQLLRIAIGNENAFSYYLNDDEWNWIWDMAHRQALTGIVFDGICLLPQKQRPPPGHYTQRGSCHTKHRTSQPSTEPVLGTGLTEIPKRGLSFCHTQRTR